MSISKETVMELKKIIKEDYGKELSYEEVWEIAHGLVGYFDLLAKINHRIIHSTDASSSVPSNAQR
jgi:hypothetical protein